MDLQEPTTTLAHRRRLLLQEFLVRFTVPEREKLLAAFEPAELQNLTNREDLVIMLNDFESWGDNSLDRVETSLRVDTVWRKRLISTGILEQLDQLKKDEGRNKEALPAVIFTNRRREFKRIDDNNPKLMQTWLIDAPAGYGKSELLKEIHRRNIRSENRKNGRTVKSFLYSIPRDLDFNIVSLANELIKAIGCKIHAEVGERPDKIGLRIAACILRLPIGETEGQEQPPEGKRFSEEFSSEINILIDNVDTLNEKTFGDLAELILGLSQEFETRSFFDNQNRFRIFLAGRNVEKRSSIFRDISLPYYPIPLSPFEFQHVEDTVREYTSLVGMPQNRKVATGIAAHIMYLTGGHPGAMARILLDLTRNDYAGVPRCLEEEPNPYLYTVQEYTAEIVNDHSMLISHFEEDIVKFLPENVGLLSIIETLSVFRQYGTWLLHELMERGLIQWKGRAFDLKDILSKTWIISKPIFEPSSTFLRNDISGRLLSMRLRESTEGKKRFAELCQLGLTLFSSRILRPAGEPVDILALEWLYQELQHECHVKVTRGDALKQRILGAADHIMDFLVLGNSSLDVVEGFTNSLKMDWEFGFLFNYFAGVSGYSAQPFMDLEKSVEKKFKEIVAR